MLRAFRDNWHKSKAAVIVEKAFERTPTFFILPGGPARIANTLIENLWSYDAPILDGSEGPRPHAHAVAAAALVQAHKDCSGRVERVTYMAALFTLLRELEVNRFGYSLNGPDLILLQLSTEYMNVLIKQEEFADTGVGRRSGVEPTMASEHRKAQGSAEPERFEGNQPSLTPAIEQRLLDPELRRRKLELDQRLRNARM